MVAESDYLAFCPARVDACYVGDERVRAREGDFYGGWITSNILGPFKGRPGTLWMVMIASLCAAASRTVCCNIAVVGNGIAGLGDGSGDRATRHRGHRVEAPPPAPPGMTCDGLTAALLEAVGGLSRSV
jgi:hypothetical protein